MEFCSSLLGCKISTDKPYRDGFPVTNLIDFPKKEFIGESFVRPPCDIKFEFPVPIDISCIKLQTQVGERRVQSLKIFMKTNNNSEEYCLGNWYSIRSNKVLLKNYEYKHWLQFGLPNDLNDQLEDTHVGALKNTFSKMFANRVQTLHIIITSVTPTGPPVLKSVHIWGQPSASCSITQKNNIFKKWTEIQNQNRANITTIPQTLMTENVEEKRGEKRKMPEGDIPEEFLDPLTWEVMRLPILLPSGNSIDSFSLEKFLSNEAAWGRMPSDPFTGVSFKNSYKPEANVHLKARIDRYFLIEKHVDASCLNALGHTLMDTYKERKPETSQATSDSKVVEKVSAVSVSVSKDYASNKSATLKHSVKDHTTSSNVSNFGVKPKHNQIRSTKPEQSSSRYNVLQTIGTAISSVKKHRSCVQPKTRPSLTEKANSSIPSTSISKRIPSSPLNICDVEKYSVAGLALASLQCVCGNQTGLFYALKCQHNVCDKCIKDQRSKLELKCSIRCVTCGDQSSTEDIKRIHPKSAFAS